MNADVESCNHIHVSRPRQARGRKARRYYQVRGDNGIDWDIPNNNIETVRHAILERVFFTKSNGEYIQAPKPWDEALFPGVDRRTRRSLARAYLKSVTKPFRKRLMKRLQKRGKVSPMTDTEFVSSYGGTKRRVYEAAVRSLEVKPLSKSDCRVKTFTKDEYRKPGGAPRAIQPRSPRFNVCLGRYIRHMEKDIYKDIDDVFDPSGEHRTVAKGMNMRERGAEIQKMWDRYMDPVAVALDASRFDQHVNVMLLDLEHDFYRALSTGTTAGIPTLNYLLSKQRVNDGRYYGDDGKIKYRVEGNRMSGDMNTSMGNVIVMCMLMHSYISYKGLTSQVSLLNDGDDCVLIMDRKNLDSFNKDLDSWFRKAGITMSCDGTYWNLEDIEFCQARPVVIDNEVVMVPRPTKRLYSDLISTKDLSSKKVFKKWFGAVAGCGLAQSTGVPIFSDYYNWMADSVTPWIPTEGDFYYKYRDSKLSEMKYRDCRRSPSTRLSFYFAFGITPDEQVIVERYYNDLAPFHWVPPQKCGVHSLDPAQYLVVPEQGSREYLKQ